MESFHDRMWTMIEEFEERIRSLEGEIVLLKRAVVQGTPAATDPPPAKVRVPYPKPLVARGTQKTWRTSSRTWSNTSSLLEYRWVNK